MAGEGVAPTFLISAIDGNEWSATRPGIFISGERDPNTNWIGGWVGPIASLKKKKILPLPEIKPRPSSPKPVAVPT
jgi:hypothetical protein